MLSRRSLADSLASSETLGFLRVLRDEEKAMHVNEGSMELARNRRAERN